MTTAGIHPRGDAPFTGGDPSFRAIPADTSPSETVQSHASIGFDRTAFQRDINVVFPVDRVREFVDRGEIGSLSRTYFSFMGAQRPPYDRLLQESGPEVARRLRGGDRIFDGTIQMGDYYFLPTRTQVSVGDTLTWENDGSVVHTATASDKSFDTGDVAPGQSVSVTFNNAGTFTYNCSPHPWMIAQIVVQ